MILLAISAAVLQVGTQTPRDTLRFPAPGDTTPVRLTQAPDTAGRFDAPGTRELVRRVQRAGSTIPAGLDDYQARMRSSIYLSLRADSAEGGEIPVTIDEFAGDVRWAREGGLEQRLRGHRIRQLAPTPYTIGSWLESPWVVPHLYGNTIDIFQLAASPARRAAVSSAVHPFSARGIDFYVYTAEDTVRVRTQQGVTTLVPVTVRPRLDAPESPLRRVAGTFYIDVDRAAVARARFGFTEAGGRFSLTEAGVFFELENALVDGRFWLPVRQRREIQITSPLFGGAAAVRLVTALSGFGLNTGWRPEQSGARLVRELTRGDSVFAGLPDPATRGDNPLDIGDFADLREAIRPPPSERAGPLRVGYRPERSTHFFRYNRVEGLFLGAAARVEPRERELRSWDVYGTAGYAFSESTVRGEVTGRYHPVPAAGAPQYTLGVSGYRRLRDTRIFRPAFEWELGYALGAAFTGIDRRDYYDTRGAEVFGIRRLGPFSARLGGRVERHDSVARNTERSLIGDADEFPFVAAMDAGTHAALEGELRYARGPGAFGIAPSLVASLAAEAGLGDFRTQRVTATLSTRRPGRYLTLLARGDVGWIGGEAPPHFLIRFGGGEGLRGYDDREFAGSRAALGRARVLAHIPPFSNEPLLRLGFFLVPPLRPALVLSGDAGWSAVSRDSEASLNRLLSRTTDGTRYSYGSGLSLFEDAVSIEHVWPGDGGEGRWYAGFTAWF
ncbi:MAG TPA: hypothetical protein VF625_18025 [Longimicrobium sp.]